MKLTQWTLLVSSRSPVMVFYDGQGSLRGFQRNSSNASLITEDYSTLVQYSYIYTAGTSPTLNEVLCHYTNIAQSNYVIE